MAVAKAKREIPISKENIEIDRINIYATNNIEPKFKKLNLSNVKVLILSLLNNPTHSFNFINQFIIDLSNKIPNAKFSFFTNNNNESSHLFLDLLVTQHKNVQLMKYKDETISIENRIQKFAEYRNLNFTYAIKTLGDNFDYVIVFDSDLSSSIPVDSLIQSMTLDHEWSCISANCTYLNSEFYYDELALRLPNSPKDISAIHPNFYNHYGTNQEWLDCLRVFNGWTKVDSAFGCCAIYKMSELLSIYNQHGALYNIAEYPPYTAEHVSLHDKLSNIKLISPLITFNNSAQLQKETMNDTAFVPRDAGFFSVFNFYIGTLTQGHKSYPLWNKNELLNMHHHNQHFAYWTENFNCWFDYFEPVCFYDNDNTHTNNKYLELSRYSGESAPEEFRIPDSTKKLLKGDKNKFQEWRNHTHHFYKSFIKFNKQIIDEIETIWQNNLDQTTNIIGVHYRHPSHFIESGKIYLEDYFVEIDRILNIYPNSKIFLASDSQFGIYAFVEKYKDRIFYIDDIDRISMSEFLHWSFGLADGKADHVGFINGKGYELHHKRVGHANNKKMTIDLLKEVLCLSRCNQVVNTISNIPLAISYINPNIEIITL